MPRHQTRLHTVAKALEAELGVSSQARKHDRERVDVQPPQTSEGVGGGAASEAAATRAMRKVTGGGSVLQALGDEGKVVQLATLQKLEETDYTYGRGEGACAPSVPLDVEKQAILEIAAGAQPSHVEVKYDLHQGFVRHALQRRFGSREAAKTALQGFVLENALACQVVAAQEIDKMSGPQAVMSGAILIDKALALEKSIAEAPKTIDFAALADMAKTLKVLKEIANE